MAVARMVVAGVDKKHGIHPNYDGLVRACGEEEARRQIEDVVALPGACDVIQTDMDYGGIGLFGGLSKNGTRFIFYEWSDGGGMGQRSVSMTKQEARDIVSGKKKTIVFKPVRYRIRLCIDPFKRPSKEEVEEEWLARPFMEPISDKRVYTKDGGAWSLPQRGERAAYDTLRVFIGRKSYDLTVGGVCHPHHPVHEERIHIVLGVPPEMRRAIRRALSSSRHWKLRSRSALLV